MYVAESQGVARHGAVRSRGRSEDGRRTVERTVGGWSEDGRRTVERTVERRVEGMVGSRQEAWSKGRPDGLE